MRPALLALLLLPAAAFPQAAARLGSEASAYLRAHADNAVDWYPWGSEALALAKRLDRPIFLSVGYSTCHWCHVMAHESFMDPEVGKSLKAAFISIKVDREERPDLDSQYMLASQLLGQQGGWPNSVWLTPDLEPFAAATYLPKADLLEMLGEIAEVWAQRRDQAVSQGRKVAAILAKVASPNRPGKPAPLDRRLLDRALAEAARRFDPVRGGTGPAPKFPPHHLLRLLLDAEARAPDPARAALITTTLDRMAAGGIHDQVGGGFHRYATDAEWHLPHFEKMLADNALLLRAYAEAGTLLDSAPWREVARTTATFMLRDLATPSGGLAIARDADSAGVEGLYYTWTLAELAAALGPEDAAFAAKHFRATEEGNFADEATRTRSTRNVLDPGPAAQPDPRTRTRLAGIATRLLEARAHRQPPALDPWVLADANGLALGALAYAGRVLAEPVFTEAATRLARTVLGPLSPGGHLHHALAGTTPSLEGQLDDHAFLADGLLELFEATHDPAWLSAAEHLATTLTTRFEDPEGGGFFRTPPSSPGLLTRPKDPTDSALPSGDGVATRVLVRLAALTENPAYAPAALRHLEAWSGFLAASPEAAPSLIGALAGYLDLPAGSPGGPAARVRIAPLTVEARPASYICTAGQPVTIFLDLSPDPGWHLASPTTTLALDPHPQLALAAFTLPAGPIDHPIRAAATLTLPASAEGSLTTATLRLSTQACDAKRCLEPAVYELPVPLRLAPSKH